MTRFSSFYSYFIPLLVLIHLAVFDIAFNLFFYFSFQISHLVEEVQRLQISLSKIQESSMQQITRLEEQLEQKRQHIARLESRLEQQRDYEDLKRENR